MTEKEYGCEDTCRMRENLITEFSETLWFRAVDQVTVCTDGKMIFAFKDGSEIKV